MQNHMRYKFSKNIITHLHTFPSAATDGKDADTATYTFILPYYVSNKVYFQTAFNPNLYCFYFAGSTATAFMAKRLRLNLARENVQVCF